MHLKLELSIVYTIIFFQNGNRLTWNNEAREFIINFDTGSVMITIINFSNDLYLVTFAHACLARTFAYAYIRRGSCDGETNNIISVSLVVIIKFTDHLSVAMPYVSKLWFVGTILLSHLLLFPDGKFRLILVMSAYSTFA